MVALRKSILLLPMGLLVMIAACGGDDPATPPTGDTGKAELTLMDMCGSGGLKDATIKYTAGTDLTTDTEGKVTVDKLKAGNYEFTVTKKGYLPVTVKVTVEANKTATGKADVECQSLVVAEAARAWLAKSPTPVTKAKVLFNTLSDGDTSNDPLVVSVRGAADYANGHIPTAVNIPWKTVADDASLAKLGTPGAKDLVDYCYTGHTGAIASTVLNMLGYTTLNMKFGFAAWTDDATARGPKAINPEIATNDFTVETKANTAPATNTVPWLENDGVTTADEAIKAAAKAYLSEPTMAPVTSSKALFDNLNDGDKTNDPFIISVRAPEDYAKGHIPGAINIPWKTIALADNLKMIPTDRPIVVYCYSGHTGGMATGVLGVLGYHKVTNLKYGMFSWTQDANVRVKPPFDTATDVNAFPTNQGKDPGVFPSN